MKEAWRQSRETEERNARIVAGTEPLYHHTEEWRQARQRMLEMQSYYDGAQGAAVPETSDDNEEPWQVQVTTAKPGKKLNKNQRRAAARGKGKGKTEFTGVLEEESDVICAAGVEWEKLEMTVDSGAAETICPATSASNVPTVPGAKMKQGVRYTCAGGKKLDNLGEKHCLMSTEESETQHRMTMQVAEVNRALLSVSRAVDGGNRVVFDQNWSYIENKRTGERTTIQRRGGLYVLETWIKSRDNARDTAAPFGRQGSKK